MGKLFLWQIATATMLYEASRGRIRAAHTRHEVTSPVKPDLRCRGKAWCSRGTCDQDSEEGYTSYVKQFF